MNVSRRKPVLLLALLSASVLGFCEIATRPAAPAGWKTERWEAGFGSWSRGGFGVAYDVQMPNAYDFQQKCGTAWISDNVDGPDFTIRMSFRPRPKDRQDDFNDYWRTMHPKTIRPIGRRSVLARRRRSALEASRCRD